MSEEVETTKTTEPVPYTTTTETPDEITTAGTTTTEKASTKTEVHAAKSYVSILKENPLYSDSSKLFHWRDPVKTGVLFGVINFFYFLTAFFDYSIVTLVSYLLFTLLCICIGYANYVVLKASWLQGKTVENPFKEKFQDAKFHVSKKDAEAHFHTVLDLINTTIDTFRAVFYSTNLLLSLKFVFYFYVAATIGNWFSGITLLYLISLGLFVWPRLYEEKQKEIDQFYNIAKTQANTYIQLGLSKLPPAVTAKFPQLKPKNN